MSTTTKTTYSVKRYRRDKSKPDAVSVIQECEIERVRQVQFKLRMHLNAAPGGTSVLVKHDEYHNITRITRTPKHKRGGYGNGVVTYALGDDTTEYDYESILHIIADRIEEGYYNDKVPT